MKVISEIIATKIRNIGTGEGRNSEVFIAEDPQLGGEIALKEIPLSQFSDPALYYLEAQTLYANRHPRVVPVLYACQDANYIRIAMPYYENGSLNKILKQRPLTIRKSIEYGQNILAGLHHIHSNDFVHFDIKPTNILIHQDGSAMISDFGQSRCTNNLGVAEIPPMYSFHIPPECFSCNASTKQADIYQTGLTLYRMVNGNKFFKNQIPTNSAGSCDFDKLIELIIRGNFPNRNSFLPHVPRRMKRVIRKALNIDPGDRYQTALEMADALGQVDTLLDWEYNENANTCSYCLGNNIHRYTIEATLKNNLWFINGFTERLSDGLRRVRNPWNGGPFKTQKQVYEYLQKLFLDMEVKGLHG